MPKLVARVLINKKGDEAIGEWHHKKIGYIDLARGEERIGNSDGYCHLPQSLFEFARQAKENLLRW